MNCFVDRGERYPPPKGDPETAETQNVKTASAVANAQAESLTKAQLAEVEKKVNAFAPLAKSR